MATKAEQEREEREREQRERREQQEAKREAKEDEQAMKDRRLHEETRSQEFMPFRRRAIMQARPWRPGEDMENIKVLAKDANAGSPKPGDMIVYDPAAPNDQQLMERAEFVVKYQPATEEEVKEAEQVMKGEKTGARTAA